MDSLTAEFFDNLFYSMRIGKADQKHGLVVLLGAGCSQQYGLPSFSELLLHLFEHYRDFVPKQDLDLASLRVEVERIWLHRHDVDHRRCRVADSLRRTNGEHCLGYVLLAQLAKARVISRFVTLNFDTLLEEALAYEGVDFAVYTDFSSCEPRDSPGGKGDSWTVAIYKPHGTLASLRQVEDCMKRDAKGLLSWLGSEGIEKSAFEPALEARRKSLQKWTRYLQAHLPLFQLRVPPKSKADADKLLDCLETSLRRGDCLPRGKDASAEESRNLWLEEFESEIGNLKPDLCVQYGLHENPTNLILDTTQSTFFADGRQEVAAVRVFEASDLLVLGYSGVDDKIISTLRKSSEPGAETSRVVFVANVARPLTLFEQGIVRPGSEILYLLGEEAAFERFALKMHAALRKDDSVRADSEAAEPFLTPGHRALMLRMIRDAFSSAGMDRLEEGTQLEAKIIQSLRAPSHPSLRASRNRTLRNVTLMTREEIEALEEWLDLAMDIRLSLNVAERSERSLEQHGYDIYARCLLLARCTGICLSAPEKFILHAAAFVHDLGYYQDVGRYEDQKWVQAGGQGGWNLLRFHGLTTRRLLEGRLKGDPGCKRLAPNGLWQIYPSNRTIHELVWDLCAGHTGFLRFEEAGEPESKGNRSPPSLPTHREVVFESHGIVLPFRFELLVRLFALAEDLDDAHPFRPSPDPVGPAAGESRFAIVDPVLDLYLRKERPFQIEALTRGRIVLVESGGNEVSYLRSWLVGMLTFHLLNFNEIYKETAEKEAISPWPLRLTCRFEMEERERDHSASPQLDHLESLLRLALIEAYQASSKAIRGSEWREAACRVDLLAMYTKTPRDAPGEVRIHVWGDELKSGSGGELVLREMKRLKELARRSPLLRSESILWWYFNLAKRPHKSLSALEKSFLACSERILLPAWRFFARKWHDSIESLEVAQLCLDFGSTGFRGEILGGIRQLVEMKIDESCREEPKWYAHDGCTLCTSQLIYCLVAAREILPPQELRILHDEKGVDLDDVLKRLLLNFSERGPTEECWRGMGSVHPSRTDLAPVQSLEYLAWSARAMGRVALAAKRLRGEDSEGSGGPAWARDETTITRLLRERWLHLADQGEESILHHETEPTFSFVFGQTALACLELLRIEAELQPTLGADVLETVRSWAGQLVLLKDKYFGRIGLLPDLFAVPVELLRIKLGMPHGDEEVSRKRANAVAHRVRSVIQSPVWIERGPEAGSWGGATKTTQLLSEPLLYFWRYCLEDETVRSAFEPEFERLSRE